MPQASNAQRQLMQDWFGDPISDAGPTHFLLSRGYSEKGGLWQGPVPHHLPTQEELECLLFLMDEWDHFYSYPMGYRAPQT